MIALFYFIKLKQILIYGNCLAKRIIWNDNLNNLLIESVKKYQSEKGKKLIPWKTITKEVKEFNIFSDQALRKKYQTIRKIIL